MTSFIECDNLVKIYKVADLEVVALQGLDLSIDKGDMIALIGPSGSGKSTLMNILGGLDVPSAGKVSIGSLNLLEMSQNDRVNYRRNIVGFLWQQTARNLIPYLTALENVELPMVLNRVKSTERDQRSRQLLRDVGLENRQDLRPHMLSGGEQQRVALAVAMANNPQVLLADEPTGEVDSEAAGRIFDIMHVLNQTYSVTTIIVTHDHEVSRRVNRVIGMRDGRASVEVLRRRDSGGVELTEEEFAVLDRTGRLQLPKSYVEALNMQKRVLLKYHEDHIRIYPDNMTSREVGFNEE